MAQSGPGYGVAHTQYHRQTHRQTDRHLNFMTRLWPRDRAEWKAYICFSFFSNSYNSIYLTKGSIPHNFLIQGGHCKHAIWTIGGMKILSQQQDVIKNKIIKNMHIINNQRTFKLFYDIKNSFNVGKMKVWGSAVIFQKKGKLRKLLESLYNLVWKWVHHKSLN